MPEGGEINVYNPDKQISEQVTLKNIVMHNDAMALSRTGIPEIPTETPPTHNERMHLRFKGLNFIISAQQNLISSNLAIFKHNSLQRWMKKNKTLEEKDKVSFDKEKNPYTYAIEILSFLDRCETQIIEARKTKRFDDDFLWEKEDHEAKMVIELSPKFFEMIKLLEESYEAIHGMLLKDKIISSGLTIDEEMDYKQKEDEVIKRIIEA